MNCIILHASPHDMLCLIRTLPSSPAMLPRLLCMLSDPNTGLDELTRVINMERSLAASVIRAANSPRYSGSGQSSSVEEAIQRIGFSATYRMVSAMLCFQPMARPLMSYRCTAAELCQQSLITACAARAVAQAINDDTGRAYVLGLMHHAGMVVIDQLIQQKEPTLVLSRGSGPMEWRDAEMNTFGFDQADVAARMLEAWEFPKSMVNAIRFQFRPAAAKHDARLAALVQVARWIRLHEGETIAEVDRDLLDAVRILGCPLEELLLLPVRVSAEAERLWQNIGLSRRPAAQQQVI